MTRLDKLGADFNEVIAHRLVYAAHDRCYCGSGLAYDSILSDDSLPVSEGSWSCSAVLLGIANSEVKHISELSFTSCEIKAEENGQTTRLPIRRQSNELA